MRESPEGKYARVASVNLLLDFLAAAAGPLLGGLLVVLGRPHKAIALLLALVVLAAVASSWMPGRPGLSGTAGAKVEPWKLT